MKNIAVIGAGTMGNGIAHVFAQSGYNVTLIDLSQDALERALSTITKNLDRQLAKEKITVENKEDTLGRITLHTNMAAGIQGVDLVVEAATENTSLKLKIFKQLDELADSDTILATNTSSYPLLKLQR
jgi:3-hydroxybutyryl-CoA dehydrogenase